MNSPLRQYAVRRVYETTDLDHAQALRLSDRVIELGGAEQRAFAQLAEWLPTARPVEDLERASGMDAQRLARFAAGLSEAGLLYRRADAQALLTGEAFHQLFAEALPSWLSEAFSHPFWERMTSGRGSARLFSGWLLELYHYTRNANRHMPLSTTNTHSKPIKLLRARHYAEEWNHYHYFLKSLRALGFTDAAVVASVPLPTTLALSNFMRQAAREDVLAYSICSAVLEGTTTDKATYNAYYEKATEHYGVPRAAIQPIYDHLALDVQYQHSDLFLDILKTESTLSAQRASRILDYGHQLVEHIWMWTDNIEKYYGVEGNVVPRAAFDPSLD